MIRTLLLTAALLAGAGAAAVAQTPAPPPLPANCTAVHEPFIGTICTPAGAGRHPALLLLGGSEGGDLMGRFAPEFAARGYVAVSVAYFGEPGLPQALVDVPVETVGRALAVVAARPDVDASHIGIFGGSKGGELALLAASIYPQIDAVVADVPSPFAWFGLGANGEPQGCSWTYQGRPLPCVPPNDAAGAQIGQEYMSHQPLVLRALYDASMNGDPAAVTAAFFTLERIHGPVLCLSGASDELWDSPAYCSMAMSYLRAHRHPYADRSMQFPNAGHTFLWATHGPSSAILTIPIPGSGGIALGGTAQGDEDAAAQAWPAIWAFLAQALP